jgi:hypothetical protein
MVEKSEIRVQRTELKGFSIRNKTFDAVGRRSNRDWMMGR